LFQSSFPAAATTTILKSSTNAANPKPAVTDNSNDTSFFSAKDTLEVPQGQNFLQMIFGAKDSKAGVKSNASSKKVKFA
jgi:hypothetical protein